MKNNILLTAFKGTSSEVLLRQVTEYEILLLPNDKIRDSVILLENIAKRKYDMKTKIVFIHIPFLKNISDIDSFFGEILDTIGSYFM